MTIDSLLKKLDADDIKYDRRRLLNHCFENADSLIEYAQYPKIDRVYESIIEYQLHVLWVYMSSARRKMPKAELEVILHKANLTPEQLEKNKQEYVSYLLTHRIMIGGKDDSKAK